MRKFIAFFVRYPLWSNVLLFSIFGFGLLSFKGMRYSFFPEMAPDIIFIQVAYPGASPEEVEEGVVLKIEENLDGLDGCASAHAPAKSIHSASWPTTTSPAGSSPSTTWSGSAKSRWRPTWPMLKTTCPHPG